MLSPSGEYGCPNPCSSHRFIAHNMAVHIGAVTVHSLLHTLAGLMGCRCGRHTCLDSLENASQSSASSPLADTPSNGGSRRSRPVPASMSCPVVDRLLDQLLSRVVNHQWHRLCAQCEGKPLLTMRTEPSPHSADVCVAHLVGTAVDQVNRYAATTSLARFMQRVDSHSVYDMDAVLVRCNGLHSTRRMGGRVLRGFVIRLAHQQVDCRGRMSSRHGCTHISHPGSQPMSQKPKQQTLHCNPGRVPSTSVRDWSINRAQPTRKLRVQ
jgi:hypothetical protein